MQDCKHGGNCEQVWYKGYRENEYDKHERHDKHDRHGRFVFPDLPFSQDHNTYKIPFTNLNFLPG